MCALLCPLLSVGLVTDEIPFDIKLRSSEFNAHSKVVVVVP